VGQGLQPLEPKKRQLGRWDLAWAQPIPLRTSSPGGGGYRGPQRKPAALRKRHGIKGKDSSPLPLVPATCTAAKRRFGIGEFGRGPADAPGPGNAAAGLKGLDQILQATTPVWALKRRRSGLQRLLRLTRPGSAAGLITRGGTKRQPPRQRANQQAEMRSPCAQHLRCCRANRPRSTRPAASPNPLTLLRAAGAAVTRSASKFFCQQQTPYCLHMWRHNRRRSQFLGPR